MFICCESGTSDLLIAWASCCIQVLVSSATPRRMVSKYNKKESSDCEFSKIFCAAVLTPSVLPQIDAHLLYLWFHSKSSFPSADDRSCV
jgi:hypothetical protein